MSHEFPAESDDLSNCFDGHKHHSNLRVQIKNEPYIIVLL